MSRKKEKDSPREANVRSKREKWCKLCIKRNKEREREGDKAGERKAVCRMIKNIKML